MKAIAASAPTDTELLDVVREACRDLAGEDLVAASSFVLEHLPTSIDGQTHVVVHIVTPDVP